MTVKIILKILFACLAYLTGWFVYVNLNDPDPVLWIAMYGSVFLVHVLRIFDFYFKSIVVLLTILLSAYAMLYAPAVLDWFRVETKSEILGKMTDSKPYIEEAREFGGLMIAVLTLVVQLVIKKK